MIEVFGLGLTGAFWIIGALAAAGIALALAHERGRAVRQLATDLRRALQALVLPLLVLATFFAFGRPGMATVIVAPLLTLLAYRIIASGMEPSTQLIHSLGTRSLAIIPAAARPKDAEGRHIHLAGIAIAAMLFLGAITCALVLILTLSASPWFEGDARVASALARSALIVWGVAAIACLASFASSVLRLFVSLALLALLLRLLLFVGFIPGEKAIDSFGSKTGFFYAALAAIVLCVAGEWLVPSLSGRSDERASRRRSVLRLVEPLSRARRDVDRTRALGGIGLITSVTASVTLIAAIGLGMYETGGAHAQLTRGRTKPLLEFTAKRSPVNRTDDELAKQFAPVLVVTKGQQWRPADVDQYLEDARLEPRPLETPEVLTAAELPHRCQGDVPKPCFRLTIECPSAECESARDPPAGEPSDSGREVGTAYVRILRKHPIGRMATDEESFVFEYPGPPIFGTDEFGREQDVEILIQYWLFYRYDEWSAATPFGRLVQRHEADWEAVTIGLSDQRPLFVAYSAHCGGSSRKWEAIEVAKDNERTHPLVAVAEGSQANYDDSDARRPPDWGSCLGVPGELLHALTYVWGIEDVTGHDREIELSNLVLVDRDSPPMSFPGSWGGHDRTELYNGRRIGLGPEGGGPLTPPLQPLWIDPISTIFCKKTWRNRDCRPPQYARPQPERHLVEFLDSSDDSTLAD